MSIDTCHFEIHVHSLNEAKFFYIDALGLELLQDAPAIQMIAVKAGSVRISIFADATIDDIGGATAAGGHIIFRTMDIDATITRLRIAGVAVPDKIAEAPGFMRYIAVRDPSGNLLEIAEYQRDPLVAV